VGLGFAVLCKVRDSLIYYYDTIEGDPMPVQLTEDEATLLAAADRFIERDMKPSIGAYVREHDFPTPFVHAFATAGFIVVS
jgi:hypothetical protein